MTQVLETSYYAARGQVEQVQGYAYERYCNTRITAHVESSYEVRVIQIAPSHRPQRVFDVRNVTLNAFLDRVAEWLVTGSVDTPDGPSDPLEW